MPRREKQKPLVAVLVKMNSEVLSAFRQMLTCESWEDISHELREAYEISLNLRIRMGAGTGYPGKEFLILLAMQVYSQGLPVKYEVKCRTCNTKLPVDADTQRPGACGVCAGKREPVEAS